MTRKPKNQRINLRNPSEKAYRQALLTKEDHGKLPELAERIKAAHPGREIGKVSDVLHFCIEAAHATLAARGA